MRGVYVLKWRSIRCHLRWRTRNRKVMTFERLAFGSSYQMSFLTYFHMHIFDRRRLVLSSKWSAKIGPNPCLWIASAINLFWLVVHTGIFVVYDSCFNRLKFILLSQCNQNLLLVIRMIECLKQYTSTNLHSILKTFKKTRFFRFLCPRHNRHQSSFCVLFVSIMPLTKR